MKQSDSFSFNLIYPPISTPPDNHCSLYNIKYCLKIYIKMFGWSILFLFMKLFATANNWYFYKNLHLHLSEATVFVQKPPSPY